MTELQRTPSRIRTRFIAVLALIFGLDMAEFEKSNIAIKYKKNLFINVYS